MDMNGVDSYSVFTLYNPYRLVIDFHQIGAPVVVAARDAASGLVRGAGGAAEDAADRARRRSRPRGS